MPTALPFLLAACAASTPGDIAAPPEALMAPCAAPLRLPQRDATQAEVERWWGHDRSALRDCAARHGLLIDWAEGQMAARP